VSADLVKQGYGVSLVCRVLDLARSSFYRPPTPHAPEPVLTAAVLEVAGQWPTYGYRRVQAQLQRAAQPVSERRVRQVMDVLGLKGKTPQKKVATTNSRHSFPRFPNQVAGLIIQQVDQVWVADITYIHLGQGFVYLAVLMDIFTRQIRGWELARSLDQTLTLAALERALTQACPQVHHSDQGVQYAATAYVARLQALGVGISMAAVGKPEENPYAERLIRTIKEEEVDLSDYHDFTDAYQQIGQFLTDVYNRKRIHSALAYQTPAEFAARQAQGAA
jgi:transposase InsO family protein